MMRSTWPEREHQRIGRLIASKPAGQGLLKIVLETTHIFQGNLQLVGSFIAKTSIISPIPAITHCQSIVQIRTPPEDKIFGGTGTTDNAIRVVSEVTSVTTATGTDNISVKGRLKANLCFWKDVLSAIVLC